MKPDKNQASEITDPEQIISADHPIETGARPKLCPEADAVFLQRCLGIPRRPAGLDTRAEHWAADRVNLICARWTAARLPAAQRVGGTEHASA